MTVASSYVTSYVKQAMAPLDSFSFISINFYKIKIVDFCGIRTWNVGVEGKYTDRLTTIAQMNISDKAIYRLVRVKCKAIYIWHLKTNVELNFWPFEGIFKEKLIIISNA